MTSLLVKWPIELHDLERKLRMWFQCCQRRCESLAGGPTPEPSEEAEQLLEEEQIERWGASSSNSAGSGSSNGSGPSLGST